MFLAYRFSDFTLSTAEAVTLAQRLVNRETTKTQLINDGFNRYSLNSKEGLPSWFLDDETKHYKSNIPITKEAVQALRAKQRALDARPIKKVAEAKARKKYKAAQRLEKAMKKAEGVNTTADLSEREKAQQIEKLMKRGLSAGKKARKEVKVVVAKGAQRGIKGRPKGVKGRYVMLDSRMKKEVSALDFLQKLVHSSINTDARQKAQRKGQQEEMRCWSLASRIYYVGISRSATTDEDGMFDNRSHPFIKRSQSVSEKMSLHITWKYLRQNKKR